MTINCAEEMKKGPRRLRGPFSFGVSDGTRTRDSQDHNLVLYQLNYTHHTEQLLDATSITAALSSLHATRGRDEIRSCGGGRLG